MKADGCLSFISSFYCRLTCGMCTNPCSPPPSPPPLPPPPPSSPSPPASPATTFQPCQCTEISDQRRCVCLQSGTPLDDAAVARMKVYYDLVAARTGASGAPKEEL